MKLGIIIPYRNRKRHLTIFIPYITQHLKSQKIDYRIILVEQSNTKLFNKSVLMNIGAKYIYNDVDYLCFHDIDLVPNLDVDYRIYNKDIIFLSKEKIDNKNNNIKINEFYYGMNFNYYFNKYKYKCYDKMLGGVTLIQKNIWKKHKWNEIFKGWGCEDNEYWHRLKYHGYKIHVPNYKYISLYHKHNAHKITHFFYVNAVRYIFHQILEKIYLKNLKINRNLIITNSKYKILQIYHHDNYDLLQIDFDNVVYSNNIIIWGTIYYIIKISYKTIKKILIFFIIYLLYKFIFIYN